MRTVIRGCRIFDGERFWEGDFAYAEGVVETLGGNAEQGEVEYRLNGCVLMPALVDLHVHFDGISCPAYGTFADLACVPFGVLRAVDMGAEKGGVSALNAFCVDTLGFIATPVLADGTPNIVEMERRLALFEDKAVGVKVYFDREQSKIALSGLETVCAFAKSKGLPVAVHCTGAPSSMKEIVQTLSRGDILTHLYHGGEHGVTEDDFAAYALAKRKGVVLDAGMAGGVHTDFTVLKTAASRGLFPDTISSDVTKLSTCVRGGNYGLTACMSVFKAVGMAEEDIFKAVTSRPARAVSRPDWGRLAVGEKATFSVLSFGSLALDFLDKAGARFTAREGYQCKATVLNGRMVYRNF